MMKRCDFKRSNSWYFNHDFILWAPHLHTGTIVLAQCCCWLPGLWLNHSRVGVGLKSVQALLKVPIIKMLQREVGGGKQFRGVQPPLCTATAVFTTAQYENSGNIHFTKWLKLLWCFWWHPANIKTTNGYNFWKHWQFMKYFSNISNMYVPIWN